LCFVHAELLDGHCYAYEVTDDTLSLRSDARGWCIDAGYVRVE